jgi:hypothetical protein
MHTRVTVLSLAVCVLLGVTLGEFTIIRRQREIINALIDLNHDKSEYIDAGCKGRYQGTEEMLPSEATQ